MAVPVTVPRLGWSMDEGTFVEWLKRDGEPVRPGEPLFVLESEKAAENIEAIDAGILHLAPTRRSRARRCGSAACSHILPRWAKASPLRSPSSPHRSQAAG